MEFPRFASCLIFLLFGPIIHVRRDGIRVLPYSFLDDVSTGVCILEISDIHVVGCSLDALCMSVLQFGNLRRVSSCFAFRDHVRILFA